MYGLPTGSYILFKGNPISSAKIYVNILSNVFSHFYNVNQRLMNFTVSIT